ncbi:hypothetical protein Pan216_58090 [Planctomycetes bacterium Pan216]|uniref:VWFA domain-containing protein n=1 Tax=Kolteria novifilia TaxID=2527975 RepID=A0A518BD64_9BACT|nr:hypothetical protein Pan216_58090 [Planctomycetes bacterium Pan216]
MRGPLMAKSTFRSRFTFWKRRLRRSVYLTLVVLRAFWQAMLLRWQALAVSLAVNGVVILSAGLALFPSPAKRSRPLIAADVARLEPAAEWETLDLPPLPEVEEASIGGPEGFGQHVTEIPSRDPARPLTWNGVAFDPLASVFEGTSESRRQGEAPGRMGIGIGQGGQGLGAGRGDPMNKKKATFFGIEAQGKTFVYVVDLSGSMRLGGRFGFAARELFASIDELHRTQQFYVIFYNTQTFPMFFPKTAKKPVYAKLRFKRQLRQWVATTIPGGGTDPHDALVLALELEPDAIFMLTDGEFDGGTVGAINDRNREKKIPIHCVGFLTFAGEEVLRDLAESNGGIFRHVGGQGETDPDEPSDESDTEPKTLPGDRVLSMKSHP